MDKSFVCYFSIYTFYRYIYGVVGGFRGPWPYDVGRVFVVGLIGYYVNRAVVGNSARAVGNVTVHDNESFISVSR